MPETMTITLFKFDELSAAAKERARDWWREADDGGEYDSMYENFDAVAKILGIEFNTRPVPLHGGGTRYEPRIFWSGFCSQGDGLCFEGRYSYARKAHRKIREYAPKDDALHKIADGLLEIQKAHGYRIEATVRHHGHYYHKYSTRIDVVDSRTGNEFEGDAGIRIDDAVTELLRDFMEWMYRALESEHDYRMSDENVDECIRINDYTFTGDGEREG